MTHAKWPVAEVGAVARLRALAAGLSHVALAEIVIDAPFATVWGLAGDMEGGVPRFENHVRRIEVLEREGESLRLVTFGPLGVRTDFDAILQPGLCVMRARGRMLDIGMAATPEAEGRTRFAHFEGSRWLGRAGRAFFRRRVMRDLHRLDAISRDEAGST